MSLYLAEQKKFPPTKKASRYGKKSVYLTENRAVEPPKSSSNLSTGLMIRCLEKFVILIVTVEDSWKSVILFLWNIKNTKVDWLNYRPKMSISAEDWKESPWRWKTKTIYF